MENLLELPSDTMEGGIIIEERLIESLRMTWEDAKRSKLEYYIANINLSVGSSTMKKYLLTVFSHIS